MDKKAGIKRIWQDRFNDSRQWMDMVFARIYNDKNALALEIDGEIVSCLILRQLDYIHLEIPIKVAYIYGAATHRKSQRHGNMTQLMKSALRQSFERGDAVCFLHPAKRSLYGFYSRFGFATTVYIDEQRYTSLHKFHADDARFDIDTAIYDIDRATEAYNRLAAMRPSSLLHDPADFKTILIDNSIDNGYKAVVTDRNTGRISAIAFAHENDGGESLTVTDITAEDNDSATAALKSLRHQGGEKMMVIDAYPCRSDSRFEARGMARIINAELFLNSIAPLRPETEMTIRVSDPLINENNGVFLIRHGLARRLDNAEYAKPQHDFPRPDLDVSIDVLTSILFSSEKIGDIFNLPTARPYLSLLLG